MAQLNLHMTPEFEHALAELMRLRNVRTKSEAVRLAVVEAVDHERHRHHRADFRSWLGLGLRAPQAAHPRFQSDDDLWD